MNYEKIGLNVPEILLPKKGTDLRRWAVVACDQYTSQPEYWERVEKLVEGYPSTYDLIIPEAYLEGLDHEEAALTIKEHMENYLNDGTLRPSKPGFILVDRKTPHASSRKGLIVALDLEHYDFSADSTSLIRATEGTVIDRLPPRVRIRSQAPLELPHIMVLIDDPEKTVIEPLFEMGLEKIYDFDLMMNSGHLKGYLADRKEILDEIARGLAKLADPETFSKKYQVKDKEVLLYAMGDGNHSLATAKAIWEEMKKSSRDKEAIMEHPARYSLVELVNVHDEGLEFEPIHRVVFNVSPKDLLAEMKAFLERHGQRFSYSSCTLKELEEFPSRRNHVHLIPFVSDTVCGTIEVADPSLNLEVGTLQTFLDAYAESRPQLRIDYIHGDDIVTDLGAKPGNMGFYLPAISKHDLFRTIILDGALPRKTFSMGNADEKRFYLECRKISG